MTERSTRAPDPATGEYGIQIKGHLQARWVAWFDGLTIRHENDGTTVMTGPIPDQSALHGVLQRVRDLGLSLVSVTRAYSPPHHQGDQP
jgi:hypothetical protein